MMAGTGVNVGGAGMLRTRRRDISIKPNRKLDRKSSRGMIYENEELRLRTIHINAEVEQGQNDIKKLRKENEQLRREIWCLRDEYEKLEKFLKMQKCQGGSDECGVSFTDKRSEEDEDSQWSNFDMKKEEYDDKSHTEDCEDDYPYDEEDDNNDDDNDNDDGGDDDGDNDDSYDGDDQEDDDNEDDDGNDDYDGVEDDGDNHIEDGSHDNKINKEGIGHNDDERNKVEQLENAENQKLSLEKISNDSYPFHVDFDGLSVVDEEEESRKDKARGEKGLRDANCTFVLPTASEGLSVSTYPHVYNSTYTLKLDTIYSSNNSIFKTSSNNLRHEDSKIEWQNNSFVPSISNDVPSSSVQGQSFTNYVAGTSMSTLNKVNTVIRGSNDTSDSKIKDVTTRIIGQLEKHLASKVNLSASKSEHMEIQANKPLEEANAAGVDTNLKRHATSTDILSRNDLVLSENSPFGGVIHSNLDVRKLKNDSKMTSNARETEIFQANFDHESPKVQNVRQKHFFAPLPSDSKKPSFAIQSTGKEISTVEPKIYGNVSVDDIDQKYMVDNTSPFFNESISLYKNRAHLLDNLKSFSSENLLTVDDHNYLESNTINRVVKSSSCQELSTCTRNSAFFKKTGILNGDLYKKRLIRSEARLGTHPGISKPFKSEIHVILRCPHRKNSSITEIPENPISENYRILNNAFQENSKHNIFKEMTTHNQHLEHGQNLLPLSQFNDNQIKQKQEYQATSFEDPYPLNLQIPLITPIGFCTSNQPLTNSSVHENVPFIPKRAVVCCSRQEKEFSYDFIPSKLPVYTYTLDEDVFLESSQSKKRGSIQNNSNSQELGSSFDQHRKKYIKNEKSSSYDEKRTPFSAAQRKKDRLKKQVSTFSLNEPESSSLKKTSQISQDNTITEMNSEVLEGKNVSRSSSSGLDSPKKEQTHRMSIYFNPKRRASLTSVKSARSTNMDNSKIRNIPRKGYLDINTVKLVRTTENSASSREISHVKGRKTSTGSASVPWCACWGNGCI